MLAVQKTAFVTYATLSKTKNTAVLCAEVTHAYVTFHSISHPHYFEVKCKCQLSIIKGKGKKKKKNHTLKFSQIVTDKYGSFFPPVHHVNFSVAVPKKVQESFAVADLSKQPTDGYEYSAQALWDNDGLGGSSSYSIFWCEKDIQEKCKVMSCIENRVMTDCRYFPFICMCYFEHHVILLCTQMVFEHLNLCVFHIITVCTPFPSHHQQSCVHHQNVYTFYASSV